MVSIDTLRADHVGAYGYARDTTPFLDALAEDGVVFSRAWAHSNWTVPSTASLLTGLYPSGHGAGIAGEVRELADDTPILQIRPGVETLAGRLRAAGFRTAMLSANPFLFGRFSDGFEVAQVGRAPADELTDSALRWLEETRGERFFLYLQYMDLHQPIEPPPRYAELFPVDEGTERSPEHGDWSYGNLQTAEDLDDPSFRSYSAHRTALYDGALRWIDDELRRLDAALARTGRAEETLLVVTADHGEELWDHALAERATGGDPREHWGIGHGHSMYEELLRVPLIVHGPGVAARPPDDCTARQVDVLPTLLDLLGLEPVTGLPGRSLAPRLRAGEPPDCEAVPVVAESPAYGPDAKAVVWDGRKLVVRSDGVVQLFDLRTDPGETRDLAAADPATVRALRAILRRELGSADGAAPSDAIEIDDETRRQLRALGYLE